MKKTLFIAIFFITFCAAVYAKEDEVIERVELRPGVETIKVGNAKVVVPKGATISKRDDVVVVEDIGEYVGRKFEAAEKRLNELKASQEELRKELQQLKEDYQKEIKQLKQSIKDPNPK